MYSGTALNFVKEFIKNTKKKAEVDYIVELTKALNQEDKEKLVKAIRKYK